MKTTPLPSVYVLLPLALTLAACSASPSQPTGSAPVPAAPVSTAAPVTPPVLAQPAPVPAPVAPVVAAAPAATSGEIDFDQQVKPFFAKYCYSCHDIHGRAAGLGFDNKSGILQALTPGDADDSLLYNVLASRKMPQGRLKPTMAEVEIIKQWINQGAKVSNSIPAED